MTYRELLYKATRLCSRGEITIGEYMKMVKPLNREVEQEPVIDKIIAEIEEVQTYDGLYIDRAYVLQILDKYRAESVE